MGTCFFFNMFGALGNMKTSRPGSNIELVLRLQERHGTALGVFGGMEGAMVGVHPPFAVSTSE